MGKITKQQYEVALAKVEELLSLVDDSVPVTDSNAVLLTIFSDIIISYEQEHYPIDKPTVFGIDRVCDSRKRNDTKAISRRNWS